MTTNIINEELENSSIDAVSSSQNQVERLNTNAVSINSLSSEDWSTISEGNDNQVAFNCWQVPAQRNVPYFVSTFSNCPEAKNTTNIYQSGSSVNNNFYCCTLLGCKGKCKTLLITSTLGIVLIIILSALILYLQTLNESNEGHMEILQANTTMNKPLVSSSTVSSMESTTHTISIDMPENMTDAKIITTQLSPFTESLTNMSSSLLDTSTLESLNYKWKIVSRKQWGAQAHRNRRHKLPSLPPYYVIISETGTDTCNTTKKCMKIVREIQAADLSNLYNTDIVHNFLVGGDGIIYEGRGWDVYAGVTVYDTEYFDKISIRISFIGKFDNEEPTEIILQAAKTLLKFGVENKKLAEEYKFMCLEQLSHTIKNPGDKLSKVLTKWERWDSRTIEDFPET